MGRRCQHVAQWFVPSDTFSVAAFICWWPLLHSDQWLVPRLKIAVRNNGDALTNFNLDVEIAEHSDPSNFASFTGHFVDVAHRHLVMFGHDEQLEFVCRVSANQIKPGNFMFRVRATVTVLMPEAEVDQAVAMLQAAGVTFPPTSGWMTSRSMFDWRALTVLKVQPLKDVLTTMAAVAAILGVLGAGGWNVFWRLMGTAAPWLTK
jgi:hypothetical protein